MFKISSGRFLNVYILGGRRETGSRYAMQAGLKSGATLLPQPPQGSISVSLIKENFEHFWVSRVPWYMYVMGREKNPAKPRIFLRLRGSVLVYSRSIPFRKAHPWRPTLVFLVCPPKLHAPCDHEASGESVEKDAVSWRTSFSQSSLCLLFPFWLVFLV